MTNFFPRPATLMATAVRMILLGLAVALPLMALPATADRGGIIEGDLRHPSGAGLVIVVGLQRAR